MAKSEKKSRIVERKADGLSIVIPAYNEEGAVAPVLSEIHGIMVKAGLEFEIIVVDDGSRDQTADEIDGASVPVTLIRHETNRGYGASLKTGIRAATKPLICITDADGTYPNECIPELVKYLIGENCDMTVGSRTGAKVNVPLIRRPAKWAIGRLANYVVGRNIPDINSGLRVFRRDLARRMFRVLPDGFSFTTTITLAMLTNGLKVYYIPINYHARVGKSKIRPIHDTLNFTRLILKMGLYFAPMKIFFPISGFLFLAGIAWGLYTRFVLGTLADVSTLIIMMTGVQVGVLSLLAELIDWRSPDIYREGRPDDRTP